MEKEKARQRVEQLLAFRKGFTEFEQEGLFDRDQPNRDRLDSYQRKLFEELARLNDAEAAAAKKRFRRRLRLFVLVAVLSAVAIFSWFVTLGDRSARSAEADGSYLKTESFLI